MYQIIKTTVFVGSTILMSFTPVHKGDIHSQYASKQGVTAFSFSKEMVDVLGFDFDFNDRMKYVKGDLTSIKFLAFDKEGQSYSEELLIDLKKSGYEKIKWEGDENDGEILLYADRNGKRFAEIHFITMSNEKPKVMISFYGDIIVTDHQ